MALRNTTGLAYTAARSTAETVPQRLQYLASRAQ